MTILLFDEGKDMPNSVLFTIQVPIEPPQSVFPTARHQAGVRTYFDQKEPLDLRRIDQDSGRVAEDVSKNPGQSAFGILCDLGASSIFDLSVSGYRVGYSSVTVWQSCNDIH